jgi:hypothetical protein
VKGNEKEKEHFLAKTQRTPRKAQMNKENKMLKTQELRPFLATFAA